MRIEEKIWKYEAKHFFFSGCFKKTASKAAAQLKDEDEEEIATICDALKPLIGMFWHPIISF